MRPVDESHDTAAMKRKPRRRWWWRIGILLILIVLPTTCILRSGASSRQLRETREWEEKIAAFERELRETRSSSSGTANVPESVSSAIADNSESPSNSAARENSNRLDEALQLTREMHALFEENHYRSGMTIRHGLQDTTYEMRQGEKQSNRIEPSLEANAPNLERIDRLFSYADVWPEVVAVLHKENARTWSDFEQYLMRLSCATLRDTWKSGDTRALAEGLVAQLPRLEMLMSTHNRNERFAYAAPISTYIWWMRGTLDAESFVYKSSDWKGLDWSLLFEMAPVLTREEIALSYDQHMSIGMDYFAYSVPPLEKIEDLFEVTTRGELADWSIRTFRGRAIYGEMADIRKGVFEAIRAGKPLTELHDIAFEPDLIERRFFKNYYYYWEPAPSIIQSALIQPRADIWFLDIALRLIRGDSLDALCNDGASPPVTLLDNLGLEIVLEERDPGRYVVFTYQLDKNGQPMKQIETGMRFANDGALPQLEGKSRVVINDYLKN